jgi:hypothetical protein
VFADRTTQVGWAITLGLEEARAEGLGEIEMNLVLAPRSANDEVTLLTDPYRICYSSAQKILAATGEGIFIKLPNAALLKRERTRLLRLLSLRLRRAKYCSGFSGRRLLRRSLLR